MPTVLVSRISLLTPARPELFTIAATSLTVVPSVLYAMAPRRVACELPGGVVLRSLYSQKKRGLSKVHRKLWANVRIVQTKVMEIANESLLYAKGPTRPQGAWGPAQAGRCAAQDGQGTGRACVWWWWWSSVCGASSEGCCERRCCEAERLRLLRSCSGQEKI
jgi:hypothetical protein